MYVHVGPRRIDERDSRRGEAENKVCESIGRRAEAGRSLTGGGCTVSHAAARVSTASNEAVQSYILYNVSTHFQVVIADDPGERVPKGR